MRLGQNIHFTGDRTNRAVIAPVDAGLACQNTATDDALLEALEDILDVVFRGTVFRRKQRNHFILHLANTLVTFSLFGNTVRITQRARCG